MAFSLSPTEIVSPASSCYVDGPATVTITGTSADINWEMGGSVAWPATTVAVTDSKGAWVAAL